MTFNAQKIHPGGWWNGVLLILVLLVSAGGVIPAYAQDEGGEPTAAPSTSAEPTPAGTPGASPAIPFTLTAPDINRFPTVGFYFNLVNSQGDFVRDLKKADIQVLENNYDRPITDLAIVQPGVQIILAINADKTLLNRIGELTYFEYLQRDLQAWAQGLPSTTQDDFSLSTNTGLQSIREKQPLKWATSIGGYAPELKNADSAMLSLTQALDLATDPNPNPYMKRAILYVTPLPSVEEQAALANLAGRANQLGVRVFIWAMMRPADALPQNTAALQQFAETTGGRFFAFTGKEALPDPNSYFEPMRYLYLVNYNSGVQQSGSQRVMLRVEKADLQAVSNEQTFSIKVSPPNPIFMNPPAVVRRGWAKAPAAGQPDTLQPLKIPVRFMVEFPDGRQRMVKTARLLVDGQVAVEKTSPPFDRFEWPLEAYTTSGPHHLVIEVEDSLGMKSSSIETTVNLEVQPPRPAGAGSFLTLRRLAVLAAILAAGGVLALVLSGRGVSLTRRVLQRARLKKDPLTQPVVIQTDTRRAPLPRSPTIPRTSPALDAPARLLRLSESGNPIAASVLPINRAEVTLGSDPKQAIFALDSTSVDQLHARIVRGPQGYYQLYDTGSVAGTWVNFSPVSEAGASLEHGDTINLGRVAFRFELASPGRVRLPKIAPYMEEMP